MDDSAGDYGISQEGQGLVVKDRAHVHPVRRDGDGSQGKYMREGHSGLFSQLVSQGVHRIPVMGLDPFELNVAIVATQ